MATHRTYPTPSRPTNVGLTCSYIRLPSLRVPQRRRWIRKQARDYVPGLHLSGGAAGNRTRVQRHSLKASPCAVRVVSTRISQSCEQAEMTIPVAVWCPDKSRDRTNRFVPLVGARIRVEGTPGLTDSQSLRQRVRSRADWNRRLIGCNDAYGGLLPAPARFP
jgi:hypothetical protein